LKDIMLDENRGKSKNTRKEGRKAQRCHRDSAERGKRYLIGVGVKKEIKAGLEKEVLKPNCGLTASEGEVNDYADWEGRVRRKKN